MEEVKDEFYIYSEGVQDILSEPPKAIFTWGNTILFGFIVIVLFISWFIEYPDVVVSQAIITSKNPPVFLTSQMNDKIDNLFFENKSIVKKGDWIAIVGNNANIQHIKTLDTILDEIAIQDYRIDYVLNTNLPILNVGEIQSSYNGLIRLVHSLEHHQEDGNYNIQSSIQFSQLKEYENLVSSAQNDKIIAAKEFEIATQNLKRYKSLFEKGVIAKQELETQELRHLQSVRNLEAQESRIYQLNAQKLSLNSQQKNLEHSEEETILNNELDIFEAIKNTEIALNNWKKQHIIESPIDGELIYLNEITNNQYVQQLTPLFSVLPTREGEHICNLRVPMVNSGKVKIGQKVNITLDGFNSSEYGTLKGEVTSLSNVPNEGFFLASAKLPKGLTTNYDKKIKYLKNITGSAQIITEDLKLIERFFYQFKDLIKRD